MRVQRMLYYPRPWISILLILLAGCAGKDAILPQDGPTMQEVYDQHFGIPTETAGSGPEYQARSLGAGDANLAGYTREAHNEIRAVFPLLPNPILVMYVYPHLTAQGYPVPGYATSFPMYERSEYALPGEVGGW